MQILKPLDHTVSLSRHAHSSQLLQPLSGLRLSHTDIKAAASCFQITLDLCGFRAKSHKRSCCLNFCAPSVSCRAQVSRAGEVLALVRLLLRTWTAVKRAGSTTAPDLKGGSKAGLAEGKKPGKSAGSGEANQRKEPSAHTKPRQPEPGPGPGGAKAGPPPRLDRRTDGQTGVGNRAGRRMMSMNSTGFLAGICLFLQARNCAICHCK